jgi:plastocyanin
MKKTLFLVLVLLALALACTKQPTTPTTATPPPTGGGLGIKTDVAIKDFAFVPSEVTIPQGTTVIWTNEDSVQHIIVSDSGQEMSSGLIDSQGTFAHTFSTAGTFDYHCSIHPSMTGKVIVQEATVPK